MRLGLPFAALVASGLAWIAPVRLSGPWHPTNFPTAVETAPDFAVVDADTLRLEASAWRNYTPRIGLPCGGADAHQLQMDVLLWPARTGSAPPVVDSVWLVHRLGAVVSEAPNSLTRNGSYMFRYPRMPDWAAGDSFTVLVAVKALPGGQRYMAVPVYIYALL